VLPRLRLIFCLQQPLGPTLHVAQPSAKFGSSMKTYLLWAYFVLPPAVWRTVFLLLGNVYRGNFPAFRASPSYSPIFFPSHFSLLLPVVEKAASGERYSLLILCYLLGLFFLKTISLLHEVLVTCRDSDTDADLSTSVVLGDVW